MVAVAIIGVLASIAYPMYDEQVRQSRRADATASLVQLAQFMERFYTVNHRYDETVGGVDVALPFNESPIDGNAKYYDLIATNLATNTYRLEAAPKGAMAGDECGTLSLTHTGTRARSGTIAVDRCWR